MKFTLPFLFCAIILTSCTSDQDRFAANWEITSIIWDEHPTRYLFGERWEDGHIYFHHTGAAMLFPEGARVPGQWHLNRGRERLYVDWYKPTEIR